MADLALIAAVKDGDAEAIERLTSGGADINEQDEHGWTPLMWAAGRGDTLSISAFLDRGSDVTVVCPDGRTALMIAKAAGHRKVIALLVEAEKMRGVWKDPLATCSYCRSYHLSELRSFEGWAEATPSKTAGTAGGDSPVGSDVWPLYDESIVYLHQDLTVTRSMWQGEGVLFDEVTSEWREFCENTLGFCIPEHLL